MEADENRARSTSLTMPSSRGGDRKISAGVRAAWDDDPAGLAAVPAEQATTWRELARYLDLARRTTSTKGQEHP